MLVKDLIKLLSYRANGDKIVCVYIDGEPVQIVDIDTGISDRVDLVIGEYVIDNRIEELNQRVEELEGQNAFECECVKERDSKLKEIRKRIMSIHKKVSPEVAVELLNMLGIIDQ